MGMEDTAMTTAMAIQYQLGNGNWTNCEDRTGEFVARAIAFAAKLAVSNPGYRTGYPAITDEETAMAAMAAGHEISYGEYWHANLRQQPQPRPAPAVDPRPRLHCRECGNDGYAGAYPFSTLPGSGRCDDCV
jgi:hypothetical protein